MEAADMFDVIHVIYEEDITPLWEQHIDVKDRVREVLYPALYDRPYKFASTKAKRNGGTAGGGFGFEGPGPADFPEGIGDTREVKPFIPVTDPEDLMKVLDGPMGG
jgi:hypothetical protein